MFIHRGTSRIRESLIFLFGDWETVMGKCEACLKRSARLIILKAAITGLNLTLGLFLVERMISLLLSFFWKRYLIWTNLEKCLLLFEIGSLLALLNLKSEWIKVPEVTSIFLAQVEWKLICKAECVWAYSEILNPVNKHKTAQSARAARAESGCKTLPWSYMYSTM